jgi:hypothetical protein
MTTYKPEAFPEKEPSEFHCYVESISKCTLKLRAHDKPSPNMRKVSGELLKASECARMLLHGALGYNILSLMFILGLLLV